MAHYKQISASEGLCIVMKIIYAQTPIEKVHKNLHITKNLVKTDSSTLNKDNFVDNYLHYKISLKRLKIPLYILDQESGIKRTANMTEKARIPINYLHYKISLRRLKIPLYILDQESGMERAANMTEKTQISTTCIIKFPSEGL